MTDQAEGGVLFLSSDEVNRALPPVEERLDLAARAMGALTGDAELPPKIGVHPRQAASFAHAMPAYVRGSSADGSADLLGLKWVSGFPLNAQLGIPAIFATVVLSDPLTGRVSAVLDGGGITAHRTAAVSGVAIRLWLAGRSARSTTAGRGLRVALVGAGIQGHSHLPVLGHLLPGADLVVAVHQFERAQQAAHEASASGAFASATPAANAIAAIDGADVVLTMIPFGPERQIVPEDAFRSSQLVIAIDYDMCVPASVAEGAALGGHFVVDERAQFIATRVGPVFAGYPDPSATIGELLVAGHAIEGSTGAAALVTHLGVGVSDLVFADAVVRAAQAQDLGTRVGGDPR